MPTLYSHIKQPVKGLLWEISKVFGVRPGPYMAFPPGPIAHLFTFSPREPHCLCALLVLQLLVMGTEPITTPLSF